MKKRILTMMMVNLFLFLVLTSAQTTEIVNQQTDLKVICLSDGAYCNATAYCNLNVAYPNNTLLVDGQNMTNQINYHNYTITPSVIGTYTMTGLCVEGTDWWEIDDDFIVTNSGEVLSTSSALVYIFILLGSLLLFAFSFYWMLAIRWGNFLDHDSGEIVSVNDWKYLKLFLIPVNYAMLMWIFGLARSLAANYLLIPGLERFFNWAFWIMLSFSVPLLILGLWLFFISIINDKKINDSLKRGSPYNGP
jgi:hypothetical protein